MAPKLLLDTHVIIRWLSEPRKLSRDQVHVLRTATARGEVLALSAVTLIEIALLFGDGDPQRRAQAEAIFDVLDGSEFHIFPLDNRVAREVAALGDALRDPADRAIVATSRAHRLRLVTSDQRIIGSNLVPVVE